VSATLEKRAPRPSVEVIREKGQVGKTVRPTREKGRTSRGTPFPPGGEKGPINLLRRGGRPYAAKKDTAEKFQGAKFHINLEGGGRSLYRAQTGVTGKGKDIKERGKS